MESYKPIKIETLPKSGLKASQEKKLRKEIIEALPLIAPLMDKIWPKKANFQVGKQKPHNIIYFVNNEPCFIEPKDGPLVPHIKLLHKYPMILPTCQVDKGGIKHVISGANIMIPGMTSKGGRLPQGKENALAVGRMSMSTDEMKKVGKGIGIQVLHFVGDEAWNAK